jgi:hypothetical protein
MTQSTRYFLVASGLIVVVGLGTGLVAVYSGGFQGGRPAGPDGLGYVTSEATAVAYADVRHIMDSEFRQRLRTVLPAGEGKDRLLTETGIDVERDIDTVVAGLSPAILDAGGPVVILRGRFDAARIEASAVRHGATAEEYKGKRLLRAPQHPVLSEGAPAEPTPAEPVDAGQERPGIAFLEPGLIALGRMDGIRRAIDAAERGETAATNADLMRFIGDVATSGDAWVAGRLDSLPARSDWPDAMSAHLSAIQWFSVSAGVDRAVTCRFRAEARDEKSAEDLRAMINGALAMARAMAGGDTRLTTLLDSVQSTGSGAGMEISFTVPPDMLDFIGSTVPSLAGPQSPIAQ